MSDSKREKQVEAVLRFASTPGVNESDAEHLLGELEDDWRREREAVVRRMLYGWNGLGDRFAAAALTGIIGSTPPDDWETHEIVQVAQLAYSFAEAMLAERAKREEGLTRAAPESYAPGVSAEVTNVKEED